MSWLDKIFPHKPAPIMRMRGAVKPVLEFVSMLATTEPMETDPDWWQVRVIALSWRN